MKRRVVACILLSMLAVSFEGCNESDITDQVANVVQAENENVLFVKEGVPDKYPDKTYGEAFESFFISPTWKYFEGTLERTDENGDGEPDGTEENADIVEFTGYCTYQEVEVKARIQFTLDKEAGTFEATYLAFNEVPQNKLYLAALMDKVFTGEAGDEIELAQETEQQGVESETMEEDPLLQEFIDLICSYSDPPDLQGEELENYFKEQYDLWSKGAGYTNITKDNTGHLQIEDHTADFVGEWWDTYSQRCHMTIDSSDGVYYNIDINWSSGAEDNTHWSFVATYDSNSNGLIYTGCMYNEHYSNGGGMQETCVYSDGEGLIFMGDDGMLHWEDYVENAGANCVFERN